MMRMPLLLRFRLQLLFQEWMRLFVLEAVFRSYFQVYSNNCDRYLDHPPERKKIGSKWLRSKQ
ncbi:hypothetical protein HanRHA438_Chr05g0223401 [Helianthus annuus]|uniref:Uncharacterized protein n=1 Tax=Helianthus annuus TaxID=4232 RepID=A0A9K3IZ67_HELAN|nr:hypothetical protein HanXRQr2_Chr05g0214051 [Helianthus annuus]KAJ0576960.1 hypothetical protein HanIR_Chr05g0230401 [Helianthus annuus]KAJ0918908.1 hypothetical protein HanRHA438_Chr05g0223401 [Helianthus annuus]